MNSKNLLKMRQQAAKISANMGVSFRKLRCGTIELIPNPRIKHNPANRAFITSGSLTDAPETWEAFIDKLSFEKSGISTDALNPGASWEMSEDDGQTWIALTLRIAAKVRSADYVPTFFRDTLIP